MAVARRNPGQGLMHHSDRGAQYSSSEYRGLLAEHGIAIGMSAKGDPYDYAVAGSFFSNQKNELTHQQVFHNHEHARMEIFNYIEVFYNRQRVHQGLGYKAPAQVEAAAP
ncbi:hypothetical protein DDE05_40525 [Streptomyces cavourensis]|nr:hypothetical protein DDE05_40525 [Streptomyces cavourensis]